MIDLMLGHIWLQKLQPLIAMLGFEARSNSQMATLLEVTMLLADVKGEFCSYLRLPDVNFDPERNFLIRFHLAGSQSMWLIVM